MKRKNHALVVVVLFTIILTGLSTLSTHLYGPDASIVQALANRFSSFYDSTQSETAAGVGQSHQDNGPWDVLISTYMRSGSTFLGRILGWRNDSFYVYEPLWRGHTWQFFREDGRLCNYLKPTCSVNDTYASTSLKRARGGLKDIFQCRFAIHSDFAHGQLYALNKLSGQSWEPFRLCNSQKRPVKECLSKMEPACQTAKHRVAKVLRMDLLYMSELLSVFPRLKVILLLRDPRGILNSHLREKWVPVSLKSLLVFENDVKVVCSRMERDMQAAGLLSKRFRDRVKIVQYEDLEETFESADSLYRFMGMRQLNNDIIEKLSNKFSSPVQRDPFSYRNTMSWNAMRIINEHCSKVYSKLGLVQYKDLNHLRNRSFPSILGKLPYTLQ